MTTHLSSADCQRGFSLLETIIALAIVSAASVMMFQTISVQFRFAERADAAVERGLSTLSAQSMARGLVNGLTPGWQENADGVFRGDERSFSGLSRNPLHTPDAGLRAFAVELASDQTATLVRYQSGDANWELARLSGRNYRFAYRGGDLVWRREWPPREKLDFPPFDDGANRSPPPLPRAIKLSEDLGADGERVIWVLGVDWRQGATPRLDEPSE